MCVQSTVVDKFEGTMKRSEHNNQQHIKPLGLSMREAHLTGQTTGKLPDLKQLATKTQRPREVQSVATST